MKINKKEVTRTEKVTEYIAEDGTVFKDENECKLYEESALFAVKKTLKKLNSRDFEECELLGAGCGDTHVEIYDIQTTEDLMRLRMYCNLRSKEGYGESLEKITAGHEVVVVFDDCYDYCWTYADGSVEGIIQNIKEKFKLAMSNDTNETSDN